MQFDFPPGGSGSICVEHSQDYSCIWGDADGNIPNYCFDCEGMDGSDDCPSGCYNDNGQCDPSGLNCGPDDDFFNPDPLEEEEELTEPWGGISMNFDNLWDMVEQSQDDWTGFLEGIDTGIAGVGFEDIGTDFLSRYDPSQEGVRLQEQTWEGMNRQTEAQQVLDSLKSVDLGFDTQPGNMSRQKDRVLNQQLTSSRMETSEAQKDIYGYMEDWQSKFKNEALQLLNLVEQGG